MQGQVCVNACMRDKYYIIIQGVLLACPHRLIQPGICKRPQESSLLLLLFCPPLLHQDRMEPLERSESKLSGGESREEFEAS